MWGDGAIAVEHVVGDARERDRVQVGSDGREHRLGIGDAEQIGEHAPVLGARERLHAVIGEHGEFVAVRGVAGAAGATRAARDLEGHHDSLTDLQAVHGVTEGHHFADALVPERERLARGEQARGQEQVDIAARDRQGTNQGFHVCLDPRRGDLAPFECAGCGASELSHGPEFARARDLSQMISPHARLRAAQPLRSGERVDQPVAQSRDAGILEALGSAHEVIR